MFLNACELLVANDAILVGWLVDCTDRPPDRSIMDQFVDKLPLKVGSGHSADVLHAFVHFMPNFFYFTPWPKMYKTNRHTVDSINVFLKLLATECFSNFRDST